MTVYVFWAAVVTSATALIIAFVAYPWQRKKDRDAELLLERLRLFKEYVAAANELYYATLFSSEKQSEKVMEFVAKAHQAYLVSSPEIGKKIDAHVERVAAYNNFFQSKGKLFDKDSEEFAKLKAAEAEAYDKLFDGMLTDVRTPRALEAHRARPELVKAA
ncbi:MAG: hypothetical protein V2I53_04720 [Paracoccaceae bacterium]|jgi:hypothetical protein|nr:hypothetical protein [Paracoccaceae bacterium]